MTSFNSYVFSKAAASRILEKKVISIAVERDRVKCQLWDKTYRTLSTARFKQHFAEYRKEQGKWLTAYRCGDEYHVTDYSVKVYSDRLHCNCKDWQSQKSIGINRPTCKHCYSVLNKLGCNSLAEYLEKNSEARESDEDTNQTSETTRQNLTSSVADCANCKHAQKIPSLFTEKQRYFCTLAYVETTNAEQCLGDRAPTLINKATI
jgi:hypothetical protein